MKKESITAGIDFEAVLSRALDMENKGHKFYTGKARESKNAVSKKTFAFLANDDDKKACEVAMRFETEGYN